MSPGGRRLALVGIALVVVVLATALFVSFYPSRQVGTTSPPGSGPAYQGSVLPLPAAAALPSSTPSAGSNTTRQIVVTGTAAVTFKPTEAEVQVSIITQGATADEASSSNAATALKVIKALNAIGVQNSSISTSSYDVSPNYNYNNQQPPSISSYTVTDALSVNITGTTSGLGAKAGQVIDTSVSAGANQVSLSFTVPAQAIAQLDNQALQQAVHVAASKAGAIASALNVSITGVLTATEGYSYYPQTNFAVPLTAGVSSAASTPIMPGTLSVSASVTVAYSIS
jgi:uncharacterized protein